MQPQNINTYQTTQNGIPQQFGVKPSAQVSPGIPLQQYAPQPYGQPQSYGQLQPYGQPQYVQQPYGQPQYPPQVYPGQPQYGMVAAPKVNFIFGQMGYPMIFPRMSGYAKLEAVKGVFIKQKFNMMQALSGCEMTHRHHVFALGPDGQQKKGSKLFKCREISNFCARQCLTPHCRPFSMEILHKDYQDLAFNNTPFLHLQRDYACTCLCLDRPVMNVTHTEEGAPKVVGAIVNPFQCCDLTVHVNDDQGGLLYKITGSCCQCGVICEGPCCQGAEFDIIDGSGEVVGNLKRVPADIIQNMFMTVANFSLVFPEKATGAQRAKLIAATIMMDYLYFDKKQQNNQNGAAIQF